MTTLQLYVAIYVPSTNWLKWLFGKKDMSFRTVTLEIESFTQNEEKTHVISHPSAFPQTTEIFGYRFVKDGVEYWEAFAITTVHAGTPFSFDITFPTPKIEEAQHDEGF